MVIVEKLAAQFEIKLIAELGDSLPDMFALNLKILVVVESLFHICTLVLIAKLSKIPDISANTFRIRLKFSAHKPQTLG